RRGEHNEAERLAREAVYLAGKTDQLDSRAEAHVDLAEVLLLGGRGREAAHELGRAISLYQEKGNEVGARTPPRLAAPPPRPGLESAFGRRSADSDRQLRRSTTASPSMGRPG